MVIDKLLVELGYDDSPNFLRADRTRDFSQTIDYGQILRRATQHCHLKGVYAPGSEHHEDTLMGRRKVVDESDFW